MAKKKKKIQERAAGSSDKERPRVTESGRLKQQFHNEVQELRYGRTREEEQPLTEKLTRGRYFGKKWFPY